jgi:diguanylate cyclase (GGDEF)-like protein
MAEQRVDGSVRPQRGVPPRRSQQPLFDASVTDLPLAVLVVDRSGSLAAKNEPWCRLTGLTGDASAGTGWLDAVDESDRQLLLDRLRRCDASGRVVVADVRIDGPRGVRWTRWWCRGDLSGGRHICVADVHDDRAREADLRERATHDPLTGLVNRVQFAELVGHAVRRLERTEKRAAVVYIDLDHFKEVNDRAGHAEGDRVLAAMATRIRRAIRPVDVAARVGGDEFAVLCEDLGGADEAANLAGRVLTALRRPLSKGPVRRIGATAGVALATVDDTVEALIDRADRAMYEQRKAPPRSSPAVDEGSGVAPLLRPAQPPSVDETVEEALRRQARSMVGAADTGLSRLWLQALEGDVEGEVLEGIVYAAQLVKAAARSLESGAVG